MSEYYSTDNKTITDFSENNITEMYNQGYVFTRLGKGMMNQTRSLRIDLSKFELNSENRRILNKASSVQLAASSLPLGNYNWEIHKLGKDFYTKKFGDDTMSASKIKEMFQESDKSNMNSVISYQLSVVSRPQELKTDDSRLPEDEILSTRGGQAELKTPIGYCLAYVNNEIVHYAYPFYDLELPKELNLGMAMMLKAILWAKENGKKYIYLGSIVDQKAKYKLQFEGLEWWDGENWSRDLEKLKSLIN